MGNVRYRWLEKREKIILGQATLRPEVRRKSSEALEQPTLRVANRSSAQSCGITAAALTLWESETVVSEEQATLQ
jgi:hypothetical protein